MTPESPSLYVREGSLRFWALTLSKSTMMSLRCEALQLAGRHDTARRLASGWRAYCIYRSSKLDFGLFYCSARGAALGRALPAGEQRRFALLFEGDWSEYEAHHCKVGFFVVFFCWSFRRRGRSKEEERRAAVRPSAEREKGASTHARHLLLLLFPPPKTPLHSTPLQSFFFFFSLDEKKLTKKNSFFSLPPLSLLSNPMIHSGHLRKVLWRAQGEAAGRSCRCCCFHCCCCCERCGGPPCRRAPRRVAQGCGSGADRRVCLGRWRRRRRGRLGGVGAAAAAAADEHDPPYHQLARGRGLVEVWAGERARKGEEEGETGKERGKQEREREREKK